MDLNMKDEKEYDHRIKMNFPVTNIFDTVPQNISGYNCGDYSAEFKNKSYRTVHQCETFANTKNDAFGDKTRCKNKNDKIQPNQCPACEAKFSNKNQFIRHLLRHIPSNEVDKTETKKQLKLICNSCNNKYFKKKNLIIHLKTAHPELYILRRENVLKKVRKKHSIQDYEEILVDDGKKTNIENSKKSKETSECPHCKTLFSVKKNLLKHLKIIHNIVDHKMKLEEHKPRIGHRCSECGKVFSLRKNLYQHLRKIHGKTDVGRKSCISSDTIRLICDACGVGFSEKKSLTRHLRIKHLVKSGREKKTVAVCVHCNSSFAHKKSLYKHERKFHGAEYKKILKENVNGVKKAKERIEKPGNIDDYECLKQVLPQRSDYRLTQFTWLKKENHSDFTHNWFKAKFNFFCNSKEEVKEWKENYEMLNKLCLRVLSFPRPRTAGVLYKGRFRCHHNTMPKKGAKPNAKHTACSAVLSITLLESQPEENENASSSMKALVFLKNTHNHVIGDPASLKYRKPIFEVKEKFLKLFEEKKTVPQALAIHKADLEVEYGSEKFQSIVNDRAFMPDARWAYGLFYSCCKKKKDDNSYHEATSTEGAELTSIHSEYILPPNHSNVVTTQEHDPYKLWINRLKNVCRDIQDRCQSAPAYFYSGLQNFVSFYENNCKTDAQLLTFLQATGRYCLNVNRCEANKLTISPKNVNILHWNNAGELTASDSSVITAATALNPFVKYNTSSSSRARLSPLRNAVVQATTVNPNTDLLASAVQSITVHETHNVVETRPLYTIETHKYDECILYPIENRQNVPPNCWISNDYNMF